MNFERITVQHKFSYARQAVIRQLLGERIYQTVLMAYHAARKISKPMSDPVPQPGNLRSCVAVPDTRRCVPSPFFSSSARGLRN